MQAQIIGKSDHKLITAVRYAKVVKMGQKYVRKRSYKNFDEGKFLDEVAKISWWPLYTSESVEEAVELLQRVSPKFWTEMIWRQ